MRLSLALFVSLCLATILLAEPSSKNNPRLKKALERFPEADANKDGVLTLSEARAFQAKNRKGDKGGKKGGGGRQQFQPQTVSGKDVEKGQEATGYYGLYMGHSFFKPAALKLPKIIPDTNVVDHTSCVVTAGGQNGSPRLLWENEAKRAAGQKYLDTGKVNLLVMTMFSSSDSSVEHYAKWFDYAISKNPKVTFMVTMPWSRHLYKADEKDLAEREKGAEKVYDLLIVALRKKYPKNNVLYCPYGLGVYELVRRLKKNELPGVKHILNPDRKARPQSVKNKDQLLNDELGHGGELVSYLNALVWLQTIYDVDVVKMEKQRVEGLPKIDLNEIAATVHKKVAPFNALYKENK